jgi:quercetin dioxygenase-like cupin family protein
MAKAKKATPVVKKRKPPTRHKISRSKQASRKTAAKKRVTKVDLKHVPWHTVELEDLNPLLQRQFVVGQAIMVARVLLKKGCIIPLHRHHNEQFSYILDGALKFWIDGRDIVVKGGEVLTIPSNMPHQAEALEDTVAVDIFNPPRADWINKTDQYLRGDK